MQHNLLFQLSHKILFRRKFDKVSLFLKIVPQILLFEKLLSQKLQYYLSENFFFIFSISSEIPIASSFPFLKQFNLIRSPSDIEDFNVLPTLFWLLEINLEATDNIFFDDL